MLETYVFRQGTGCGQHSIRVNAQWRICFVWREGGRKMSNSLTTINTDLVVPIHPGEILLEDFIEGFEIMQNKLAVAIGVPPRRYQRDRVR